MRRRTGCWVILLLLAVAAVFGWREFRRLERAHPEWFPWTELSLADPIGRFTRMKLASLTGDNRRCQALLTAVDLGELPAPSRSGPAPQCGYDDGVRVLPEGQQSIDYSPAGLVTSCPVAAALSLWEQRVVQPAALRHFG